MNKPKVIKEFINYVCEEVNYKYVKNNHDRWLLNINEREFRLLADKAIDKRIEKQLTKKYNLRSRVYIITDMYSTGNFLGAELMVRIIKEDKFYESLCYSI